PRGPSGRRRRGNGVLRRRECRTAASCPLLTTPTRRAPTMTADDTSRKAALARIAIHDVFVNAGRSAAEANDLVDAVVLPLVQERDRLAAEKAKWQAEALREAASGIRG